VVYKMLRLIQKQKKDLIKKSNSKENKSCTPFGYKVGEQILLNAPQILQTLLTPRSEPYQVTKAYKNETIQIQRGIVSEIVNICRV
jgi:hypothetical protein